jgi:Tfp pilus assembly protein FimV
MQDKLNEQLEAMKHEIARQNERWAETRAQILALGDRVLAVPREILERIGGGAPPPAPRVTHNVIRV